MVNASWRHNNSYRGNSQENRRGSLDCPSRGANLAGYQRSSYFSPGGTQEQASSQHNQQTQFQYVSGQSNRGQGNRRVQTSDSRGRAGVSVDRNVCRRSGGAEHWQNSCPSPPAAQNHLCFGLGPLKNL